MIKNIVRNVSPLIQVMTCRGTKPLSEPILDNSDLILGKIPKHLRKYLCLYLCKFFLSLSQLLSLSLLSSMSLCHRPSACLCLSVSVCVCVNVCLCLCLPPCPLTLSLSLVILSHVIRGLLCYLVVVVNPLQHYDDVIMSVSNHQPHNCLLNRLFGRRSK